LWLIKIQLLTDLIELGAVHKGHPHKIAKNQHPPFVQKMSALAQPPLSVRTQHKFRKIRYFFAPKSADFHFWRTSFPPCPQNVHTGEIPSPLTADVFYGQPLTCSIFTTIIDKELSIEEVCTNCKKLTPLRSLLCPVGCKMSALFPPLSYMSGRTQYNFRKILNFLQQKVWMSTFAIEFMLVYLPSCIGVARNFDWEVPKMEKNLWRYFGDVFR